MKQTSKIVSCLISCRNFLIEGRSDNEVLDCLKDVLENLDLITIPSTRKIVEFCTTKAIDQIKDAELVGAGLILNLIHNLPLDEASERRWDIDYFLSMELPTFLERFDEIKPARQVVLYVCNQLASRYLC